MILFAAVLFEEKINKSINLADFKNMQTLTIEIKVKSAQKTLQQLQQKQFIKIISEEKVESPALTGLPLNIKKFREWIAAAETMSAIDLKDARSAWKNKRKQLLKKIIH